MAGVDAMKARKGMLNSTEFESLLQAVNRGERMNVIIDDSPSLTANAMCVKARRMVKAGVKLIPDRLVCNLHGALPDVTESRQQQITSISKGHQINCSRVGCTWDHRQRK